MKKLLHIALAVALGAALGTGIDQAYSSVVTTQAANPFNSIVGGTIDSAVIGGTTPAAGTFSPVLAIGSTTPSATVSAFQARAQTWTLIDSSQSANNRITDCSWFGGALHCRFVNDAYSGSNDWMTVTGGQAAGSTSIDFPLPTKAKGTTTNDSAAAAYIGEYQEVNCGIPAASGASVAFTNASPTVGTWTSHPFRSTGVAFGSFACPFTITATAPTGLSTATNYWAVPIDANTFRVSTSAANAAAGTWANTSGSTAASNLTNSIALSTTAGLSPAVILLTAGDWDCSGQAIRVLGATTSVTNMQTGINSSSTAVGGLGTYFDFETAANIMTATNTPIHSTPTVRLSLASTTAEYLVTLDTFTASTNTVSGFLRCRRMR